MDERIESSFMQRVDFASMIRDVIRQWWAILLLTASVAMLTDIAVNELYTPRYTTSATFAVSAQGLSNDVYQNLKTTKTMAEQMAFVLDSNVLKRKIAEELGMDSFDAETSISQIEETNLITITVTAGSAMEAYHVINSILDNYDTVTDYVIKDVIIQIIQPATIPTYPMNSMNESHYVKLAIKISLVIFILLFAALSYVRDTVKNEKEFKDKIDAKLLQSIRHEKKAHGFFIGKKKKKAASMLISNPLRSFHYVENAKMAASRIRSYLDKRNAKVVLFTSVMENEGKSTVAANMALSLAQEGKNVILIDCDFRKPSQYKIFQKDKETTVNLLDVLENGDNLRSIISKHNDNLYMILNNTSSTAMESLIGNEIFKRIMNFCREKMDYVILDTSPMALVSETEELAQMCDASVLVVRQDTVLAKDINDAIDTLNNTRGKVIGCIFNDVGKGFGFIPQGSGLGGRYGK